MEILRRRVTILESGRNLAPGTVITAPPGGPGTPDIEPLLADDGEGVGTVGGGALAPTRRYVVPHRRGRTPVPTP